ncbi:MAG: zinc ribbon domain-containing protein [Promethearchaeota archaeon]
MGSYMWIEVIVTMPRRFCSYVIPMPIDNAWNLSIEYWKSQRGKFESLSTNPQTLARQFVFKHEFSFHIYGSSTGERYEFKFLLGPSENQTQIIIEIEFSWFGKGFVSKVPEGYLEKWARFVGIVFKSMEKQPSLEFQHIQTAISQLGYAQTADPHEQYCPACGIELTAVFQFCPECGEKISVPS